MLFGGTIELGAVHTCLELFARHFIVEAGATAFFELGPGRALGDMAAGSYPGIPARGLDEFKTLEGVRTWLRRVDG